MVCKLLSVFQSEPLFYKLVNHSLACDIKIYTCEINMKRVKLMENILIEFLAYGGKHVAIIGLCVNQSLHGGRIYTKIYPGYVYITDHRNIRCPNKIS